MSSRPTRVKRTRGSASWPRKCNRCKQMYTREESDLYKRNHKACSVKTWPKQCPVCCSAIDKTDPMGFSKGRCATCNFARLPSKCPECERDVPRKARSFNFKRGVCASCAHRHKTTVAVIERAEKQFRADHPQVSWQQRADEFQRICSELPCDPTVRKQIKKETGRGVPGNGKYLMKLQKSIQVELVRRIHQAEGSPSPSPAAVAAACAAPALSAPVLACGMSPAGSLSSLISTPASSCEDLTDCEMEPVPRRWSGDSLTDISPAMLDGLVVDETLLSDSMDDLEVDFEAIPQGLQYAPVGKLGVGEDDNDKPTAIVQPVVQPAEAVGWHQQQRHPVALFGTPSPEFFGIPPLPLQWPLGHASWPSPQTPLPFPLT
eukprot:m.327212 g.327212  ORF g.327212 m.327212 type:complete len:376 (+) comp19748_c1_seq1:94-1221(+)